MKKAFDFSKLPARARFAIEALFSEGPRMRDEAANTLKLRGQKEAHDYVAALDGEARQRVDEHRAEDVLEGAFGVCYALNEGPAYVERLYKYTADGLERVE